MHPFTTFPILLSLSFFVPTLFRVTCAIMFVLLAQRHYQARKDIERILSPLVGKLNVPMLWLMIGYEIIVAMMLFAGWYTQIAGLLGAAMAVKLLLVRPHSFSPYGRPVAALLFVMTLSLVITGAGAPALDLPL